MLTQDLISENIPPIKLSDTGTKALKWMDEFKVAHLPVVDNGQYFGLVADADIFDLNSPEKTIGEQLEDLELDDIHVTEGQHIYDAIKIMNENRLSIVPVLNKDKHYLGVISMSNLMEKIGSVSSITEPGSVLILEVNYQDYSLSQIAQIVEGNNARILSVFLNNNPENGTIDVTLKINKTDVSGILQTFQRYNYFIKSAFQVDSDYFDDLKTRYDALMNYLKM
ncbi:MAG: CBS domain-containing protein [Flavobacteriales bacterium]|nr:CBS domain-containing protein [Flavobacteriales bacterium]